MIKFITGFLFLMVSFSAFSAEVTPPPIEKQIELAEPQIPSVVSNTKKENEILVQLEPQKKAATENSFLFKALLSFAIIGLLSLGSYLFIGKYRRIQLGKSVAPQIKVLTQHYLGPKKSLAIVRVAGESILIGVTDQNINMIKSLSLLDEDIPENTPLNFHQVFNSKEEEVVTNNLTETEEFSISGIKDFVGEKLKNMRTIG